MATENQETDQPLETGPAPIAVSLTGPWNREAADMLVECLHEKPKGTTEFQAVAGLLAKLLEEHA